MTTHESRRPGIRRLSAPLPSFRFLAGWELAVVAAYTAVRVCLFTDVPGRGTDTPTYEHVAHLQLWSWRFYAGERSFVPPLLYKIVEGDAARIRVQLAISIVCWLILALVVGRSLRHRVVRLLGVAAVL